MRTQLVFCLFALTTFACEPEKEPSDEGSGNATETGMSTGEGEATSGGEPTTGGEQGGGEGSVGGTTGADETTGGGDESGGEAPSECAALCAKFGECGPPELDCMEECALSFAFYGYPGAACRAKFAGYVACSVELSCEQLAEGANPCEDQLQGLFGEACTTDACAAQAAQARACGFLEEGDELLFAVECSFGLAEVSVSESAACLAATEGLMACVAELPCEQIVTQEGCAEFVALQAQHCES